MILGHLRPLRRWVDGRQRANPPRWLEVLIRQTCAKQGIGRDQLTIHADRGSSMTSKLGGVPARRPRRHPVAQPRRDVSNDNPFSESQFKTLKYRPNFRPDRFDSIEAARRHCQVFFGWYNDEHRHTGLALHTPADVHYGTAAITRDKRAGVLDAAYAAHPERFVRKPPSHRTCPAVRGSTNQTTPRRPLSKYRSTVPHSG